jgi:hypothetical protein
MTAPQVETLVARHEPAIRRDIEAMLTAIAGGDAPAGVAVLLLDDRPGVVGLAVGSGHALAVVAGRPGAVAVQVDVEALITPVITALSAAPEAALLAARLVAEQVGIHELAHCLVAPLDDPSPEAAAALIAAADELPPRTGADTHGPRWGAAVVALAQRAILLSPDHEHAARQAALQADLVAYELDAAAIAAAIGEVTDTAAVRELLADGGAVARRVAAACRPEADRQDAIEYRRLHGAARRGLGVSQHERVGVSCSE